ncbi:hypothetical protein SFUMM280S_01389 [Streptomyces fumanus]
MALAAYLTRDDGVRWAVLDGDESGPRVPDAGFDGFAAVTGGRLRRGGPAGGERRAAAGPDGRRPRGGRVRSAVTPGEAVTRHVLDVLRGVDTVSVRTAAPPEGRGRALARRARHAVTDRRTGEASVQECLALLTAFRNAMLPRGVRPAGTVDDSVLDVRPEEGALALGDGKRGEEWVTVFRAGHRPRRRGRRRTDLRLPGEYRRGVVVLPGDRVLAAGPWVPFGHDFVQVDRRGGAVYLLRGDSGLDRRGGQRRGGAGAGRGRAGGRARAPPPGRRRQRPRSRRRRRRGR